MRIVLQRVSRASVSVGEEQVGAIGLGLLALVGVEKGDSQDHVEAAARKISGLRIFQDENGKMNFNLQQVGGEVLVVSQFTLAASLDKGRRPSFESVAPPGEAQLLVEQLEEQLRRADLVVASGRFGADMKVDLLNDGPVTFVLDS